MSDEFDQELTTRRLETSSSICADGIAAIDPSGEDIDLLILSHSNADHINAVPELLAKRDVNQVVRTGYIRTTRDWCEADYQIKINISGGTAISDSQYRTRLAKCQDQPKPIWVPFESSWPPAKEKDFNLAFYQIKPGSDVFPLGDAKITLGKR